MRVAIVLFTRDLRVHDQPALRAAAAEAETVVPLFVFDPGVLSSAGANRTAFLLDSLRDLDASLRERGGGLAVRRGDVVDETMRLAHELGAGAIFLSDDASAYASTRKERLRQACAPQRLELRTFPGVSVIPPGDLAPVDTDHYRVFTAYWRRWQAEERRRVLAAPRRRALPGRLRRGRLPPLRDLIDGRVSAGVPRGGESEGRRRLNAWLAGPLAEYGFLRDDLAADATSRLGAFLHFGCLSPLDVVVRAERRAGAGEFVRQLAWRDFYLQLLAANPQLPRADLRPRGDRWREDDDALAAWREGRTGIPVVDAGLRQLAAEGWMHNRARLLAGSFLTKQLYLDWRLGVEHFSSLLVDGDLASNVGNWQWVAGTGTDTRPNRVFNPTAQARRFDPTGAYVRRHVPELAGIDGAAVHEPWRLEPRDRGGYPAPLVDQREAVARFQRARRPAGRR